VDLSIWPRRRDRGGMPSHAGVLRTQLRVIRAARSVSQSELARAVGVSRQTISSIETGQYCPSTALALRLALTLETPFTELFWLEGESNGPIGGA
jgi:putative transcriptional regulator